MPFEVKLCFSRLPPSNRGQFAFFFISGGANFPPILASGLGSNFNLLNHRGPRGLTLFVFPNTVIKHSPGQKRKDHLPAPVFVGDRTPELLGDISTSSGDTTSRMPVTGLGNTGVNHIHIILRATEPAGLVNLIFCSTVVPISSIQILYLITPLYF